MSGILVLTPFINHDGGEIRSMDVAPVEYKLATCGTEEDGAGVVMIWSLHPVVNDVRARRVVEEEEKALLARISMDSQVNAIRWSRCCKYFAVATLDETVEVWECEGRTGGSHDENQEKYTRLHALHGHTDEVWSVDWSWDGGMLASASADERVIVWNARHLPEQLAVLDYSRDGHDGPVKGLSFDPIGRYLASQSQDKTIKVWSVANWQCTKTIRGESKRKRGKAQGELSCPSLASMRPDWTADGSLLVAPRGRNGGHPVAKLIQAGDWSSTGDLVVESKSPSQSVVVVRCAPRCFHYDDTNGNKAQASLIAVCCSDRSLSVWAVPGAARPLLTFGHVFDSSVMDVVWRDAVLFCCSGAGSVKTLFLDVGRMLRDQEMSDLCYAYHSIRPSQWSRREDSAEDEEMEGEANEDNTQLKLIYNPQSKCCVSLSATSTSTSHRSVLDENLDSSYQETSEEEEDMDEEGSETDRDVPMVRKEEAQVEAIKKDVKVPIKMEPKRELKWDIKREIKEEPEEASMTPSSMAEFQLVAADASEVRRQPLKGAIIGSKNNRTDTSGEHAARVVRMRDQGASSADRLVWSAFIPSPVVAMSANSDWTALATSDSHLTVLSSATGAQRIKLKLDSTTSQLGLEGSRCCVISQAGLFTCWDLNELRVINSRISVRDIVPQGTLAKSVSLGPDGSPRLQLADGSIYGYSPDLMSWIPLPANPISRVVKEEFGEEAFDEELKKIRKAIHPTK